MTHNSFFSKNFYESRLLKNNFESRSIKLKIISFNQPFSNKNNGVVCHLAYKSKCLSKCHFKCTNLNQQDVYGKTVF